MNNVINLPDNYYQPTELKNLLRLLSSQNAMWTRSYIVSYVSEIEDIIVLENRLYMNAIDFKNIFNIYYGDETSAVLEALLRDYTSKLIENLKVLKTNYKNQDSKSEQEIIEGQQEELEAYENWNAIGVEIAVFLSDINPYLDFNQMENLILDHIDMTRSQMEQRLQREYAYEVHQYDFIEYHSLMIADILSKAIIEMFYNNVS